MGIARKCSNGVLTTSLGDLTYPFDVGAGEWGDGTRGWGCLREKYYVRLEGSSQGRWLLAVGCGFYTVTTDCLL